MISKIKDKIHVSLKDKDFKEILSGSSMMFLAKIIATALGFVFNIIVSRTYGVEAMGLLALVNSFLAIAVAPALMGFSTSILRLVPEYLHKTSFLTVIMIYKKALLIVVSLSIFITFISYINMEYIIKYIFKKEELTFILSIASLFIIANSVAQLNNSTIRSFKDIKYLTILTISIPMLNIISLLLITFYSSDIYNPIYAILITSVIILILSFIFLSKVVKKQEKKHLNVKNLHNDDISIRGMLAISFPMFLTSIMAIVITQTDIIMLGMYSDVVQVGIYAIIIKLTFITSFILTAINSVVAPMFSEYYHSSNMKALSNIIDKSSKVIFFSTLPIVFILLLFGKYFLSVFGNDFVIGYGAMVFLLVGQLINISAGLVGFYMNMTGYEKQHNYLLVIGVIINIILNYLLIPRYGIEGAAFASMISIVYWNISSLVFVKLKTGLYIGYLPNRKR